VGGYPIIPSAAIGSGLANYAIAYSNGTLTVSQKTLTINGTFAVANKFYDGTTAATISVTNLTLDGVASGDDVALLPVAAFADKDVGSNKTVSLTIASTLTGAAAGNYTLSLADAPTATADILFPAVMATQFCPGFRSPSTNMVVSNVFAYAADQTLAALKWTPTLPAGWTLASVLGHGAPRISGGTDIVFDGPLTNRPIVFWYVVSVPGNQTGSNSVYATAMFRLASMADTLDAAAIPNPLVVRRYHSADYQTSITKGTPDWKINTAEASRVLNYYRAGGAYHGTNVTSSTPDGYVAGVGTTNSGYHSADYRTSPVKAVPDGRIDTAEASRVLGYYRGGGAYHVTNVTVSTPDGYGAGP
jgi:hypothetical protein